MGDSASGQGTKHLRMNQEHPALSVVIPARNEERRLPKTLRLVRQWINASGRTAEMIPVVQGHDGTTAIVEREALHDPMLRPVIQHEGEGKGMAVRLGVTAARGEIILFTDADLSVPVECLERLVSMMERQPDIDGILGSRRLPESNIVIRQPLMRRLAGKAFNAALKAGGLDPLRGHAVRLQTFPPRRGQGDLRKIPTRRLRLRRGDPQHRRPTRLSHEGGARHLGGCRGVPGLASP